MGLELGKNHVIRFTPDSVRVGDYFVDEVDMSEQDIPIVRMILHENWDSVTMANDICLLELGEEVDTSSGMVDITDIITEEPQLGTMCSAADWEGGDGHYLYKVYRYFIQDKFKCHLPFKFRYKRNFALL